MSWPLKLAWGACGCAWGVIGALWCLRHYDHGLFVHVMQTYFAWLP